MSASRRKFIWDSEVQVLRKPEQNMLGVWERKIFRKISINIKVGDLWMQRINQKRMNSTMKQILFH